MEDMIRDYDETEAIIFEDSTHTERLEDDSASGDFNIVLDVEIYDADGDIE